MANRRVVINLHSSADTTPSAEGIYYGELVVSHNSRGKAKLYTKVTNPSGDTAPGKLATFIDETEVDSRISSAVNGSYTELAGIVQNLAGLTITDIKATSPISASTKALVTSSCGNTVTIMHVAGSQQSGFKKLESDAYGHVTGGTDVVIGDISGLTGFQTAVRDVETELSTGTTGTGNVVKGITVSDHKITTQMGSISSGDVTDFAQGVLSRESQLTSASTGDGNVVTDIQVNGHEITFVKGATASIEGHKHVASDITGGTFDIARIPTSAVSATDTSHVPTSKDVNDAIVAKVETLDKAASSETGKFVRTVTENDGVVSETLGYVLESDVKLSAATAEEVATLGTNVKEAYKLVNGNNVQLGDYVKIYKDSSLDKVVLGHIGDLLQGTTAITEESTSNVIVPDTASTTEALNFVYLLEDGKYQMAQVNVESFLQESEFKDGLQVISNEVSVKIDSQSEGFLTVSENGVKLSGVQTAIDSAIEGLDSSSSTISNGHFITAVTIVDGKISSISENDKVNSASTADIAADIDSAPVLGVTGNTQIKVTVGTKTSDAFTVPFATSATTANSAVTSQSASSVDLSGVQNADDLKAIEALTGTSGVLRKTAADTWDLAEVVTDLSSVSSNGKLVDAYTVKQAINSGGTSVTELSGAVETLSGSVVAIENVLDDFASSVTINNVAHTVSNNSVDLGSYLSGDTKITINGSDVAVNNGKFALGEFLSANTQYVSSISSAATMYNGSTTQIEKITTTFTVTNPGSGVASSYDVVQDYVIDCGTY